MLNTCFYKELIFSYSDMKNELSNLNKNNNENKIKSEITQMLPQKRKRDNKKEKMNEYVEITKSHNLIINIGKLFNNNQLTENIVLTSKLNFTIKKSIFSKKVLKEMLQKNKNNFKTPKAKLNRNESKIKDPNSPSNDISIEREDSISKNINIYTIENVCENISRIELKEVEKIDLSEEDAEDEITNFKNITEEIISIQFLEKEFHTSYSYRATSGRQSLLEIDLNDFKTLGKEQYLNDKIILFFLKFMQAEMNSNNERILTLDTYFYQTLVSNGQERGDLNEPLLSFNSLKKWTKKFSIFEYDFVIVPINSDQHWSLIIICNPSKIEKCFQIKTYVTNNNSDFPTIIYLDSFYDDNIKIRNIFTKMLFYEFANKNKIFENDENLVRLIQSTHTCINSYVPIVPKQPNTFDCGIFLLVYVELFLYEPYFLLNRMNETNRDMSDWFHIDLIKNKRESFKKLLIEFAVCDKTEDNIKKIVNSYLQDRIKEMVDKYKIKKFETNFENILGNFSYDVSNYNQIIAINNISQIYSQISQNLKSGTSMSEFSSITNN